MIRNLPCNLCEKGILIYDHKSTVDAWQQPEVFRLDDIDKLKDEIISDILVLSCDRCGSQTRLTFKEIEKRFRKSLTNKLFTMIGRGDIPDPGSIRRTDRIYIYCNKCSGYDGKGACPKYVYDNCELKKLPISF